jgi:hypothetical protein
MWKFADLRFLDPIFCDLRALKKFACPRRGPLSVRSSKNKKYKISIKKYKKMRKLDKKKKKKKKR